MDANYHFDNITKSLFDELLEQYPHVVPSKLEALDSKRYGMQPTSDKASERFLKKEQVVTLVEWKLSHGTFRPKLKQLVESNPDETVESLTQSSFAGLTANDVRPEHVKAALTGLTALKGIGPATASLLLSVAVPNTVPFFSDELFRWSFHETGKGKGWDRQIKYTPKEYMELFVRVQELISRVEVSAVDAEKVAYVLGKQGAGKAANEGSTSTSKTAKRKVDDAGAEDEQPADPGKKAKTTGTRPDKRVPKSKSKAGGKPTKSTKEATRSTARLKAQG